LSTVSDSKTQPRSRPLRLRIHGWTRWLHIYTSMLSLIVVLFFAVTGITLNHPEWILGGAESRQEYTGQLPSNWKTGSEVDWVQVIEYLRAEHGLKGKAHDNRSDNYEASVTYSAPGYSADAFIQMETGQYTLAVAAQGPVAALNDFHRGRDTGTAWRWLIDVSGAFLVLVALTGLGMLLYLKKIRPGALVTVVVGGIIMVALMQWLV
jgi:hypothetical protein